MALFRTEPSSRILTLIASRNTSGQQASSGRPCHSATSSKTAPVTAETRSGDTSIP